jgi:hypothetical protein
MRILPFISIILVFSCGQKESRDPIVPIEKDEPVMYNMSEMAGMMEGIYGFNKVLRDSIITGGELPAFPEGLEYLHKAQATSPREIDSNFHILLDEYLVELNSVKNLSREEKIEAYNSSIQTCVDCHQTRCQGPIPKIKRLRIPLE